MTTNLLEQQQSSSLSNGVSQQRAAAVNQLEASNEVTFPKANIGSYVEYKEVKQTFDEAMEGELTTIEVTGERGYRTALSGHGVKHGDFFFEVEMLPYRTPTPFVDVVPSVRVGYANFAEQSLEMPLGTTSRSYTYSSTGKMITNSKHNSKQSNEPFNTGDVIGVYLHLLACKPDFMRRHNIQNQVGSILDADQHVQVRESRVDSMQGLVLEENKEGQTHLEVSDGSYIEFYRNGLLQKRKFLDIYEGTYHAAVSVYMNGRCKVNFGKCPFRFPPQIDSSSADQITDNNSKASAAAQVKGTGKGLDGTTAMSKTWLPYSLLSDVEVSQSTHASNLPATIDQLELALCSGESTEYQEKRRGKQSK